MRVKGLLCFLISCTISCGSSHHGVRCGLLFLGMMSNMLLLQLVACRISATYFLPVLLGDVPRFSPGTRARLLICIVSGYNFYNALIVLLSAIIRIVPRTPS